jgi:hypothetical protein
MKAETVERTMLSSYRRRWHQKFSSFVPLLQVTELPPLVERIKTRHSLERCWYSMVEVVVVANRKERIDCGGGCLLFLFLLLWWWWW